MERFYFTEYSGLNTPNKYILPVSLIFIIFFFNIQNVFADGATLAVSPTTVCSGDTIDITVSATDSDNVSSIWYLDGAWNSYDCGNVPSCSHTWSISKSSSGSYSFNGYYYDSLGNGAWTSPSYITVTVLKDNGDTCSAKSDCCSGNCVDGYCCDSACTGACDACNVTGHLGTCTDDDSLCSGTTSSCYCSGGACQSCTDPGGCSYATCMSHTCGTADYGNSHQCNSAWKCSSGTGDNNYGTGGDYKCQGYCDGSGNCDYAGNCTECRTDSENSGDSGDQPTVAGSCIDYTGCSGGSCQSSTSTEYCWDSTWLREYYASSGSCTGYWKNCNDYDRWYNYGDNGPGCLTMDDPTAEYRDYSCSSGACNYSVTSTKDCDSSDGWYGGGNTAGCGADPSSQKRDYYVNSGGTCSYTTANCPTKNCDSSDSCSNTCDGSVIKSYKDYYVISNTNTCTYVWGSTVEDCASKNTYESDGCWAYTTGGYIYDYTGCSGGSCTYNTYYDSCSSYTLTEYCASGSSYTTGTKDCRNYDVVASDSDGDNPSINGNCTPGKEGYCSDSNPDYCTNKSAGSLISDYCSNPGVVGAIYKEAIVSDINGNGVYESCTYKNYDPDTNSNTCETCTLNWQWNCSAGDCASSPNACCGDDANEYSTSRICNSNACTTDSSDKACCAKSNDCVYNNVCYQNSNTSDVDSDGIDEYCRAGTWYAYPNITSISVDKSPIDRDDEVDKFTPDTSIKITAVIYDQDNYDRSNVYITIYEPDGTTIAENQDGTPINSKLMTCSDTDSNHWSCYYDDYNPKDGSPIGSYDVKIKAVDAEGLEDIKTESNLFEVKDIYLTNLNHHGTTSDLWINGTAKYTTYDTAVSGATVKCYSQEYQSFDCMTTTDGSGNFDCNIGALDKNFTKQNAIKTNTFICEVIDSDDIAGNGSHDINIGLQATSQVWNDTTLYHDETASFNVTFKNIGDLTFAKENLFWEISSEDGTNPETDEDCHNTGWVDACGHLGKYEDDPHNSCGCYIQFDQNLDPGKTVTYSGSWKAKYHEFGNYNFSTWVRFPNNETDFTTIVAGQSPVIVSVVDKHPVKLTFMFALPSPVDRDKETPETNDNITIKINATDYVDGVFGDKDELNQYLTIWVRSDQNRNWMICENVTMNQIPYHGAYYYGNCSWNPPNNMSDADLGNFSVKFKVIGYGGMYVFPGTGYNISDYSENPDKFVVEDIDIANLKWPDGNTTNLFFVGNATYLSTNTGIKNITNQSCSQPIIPDIPDGNNNTRENINPLDLRLCGINSFVQDLTCNVTNGNFSCYVKDIKLNDTTITFSYILTDEKNISGSEDITINLNGAINSIEIDDEDKFVNIYQPINYTINFSNIGNLGWFGNIYNQTRIEICSPKGENPITPADRHISLFFKNTSSWVNLAKGTTGNFSHFLGYSYFVLGKYNYTSNLSYFWPDSLHSINFSITTGGKTNYTVAAIDITDYILPDKVIRGDQIIGKVRGYFVASMNIPYWEEVQGDTFKVTDNTTNAIYWVEKWNKTSKIKTEFPETNMTWNPSFWEGKINTFQLSCDNETTIHRVYFLINWTDYNIYVPYVKGEFKPEFWPYFYQNLSVKCVSRELFEVNPEIVNVALGTENRDIYNIYIENPSNNTVNINLTINCNNYPDAINWLNQNSWTISIPRQSFNSTIVTLNEAPRVGNYEFSVSVSGDLRYDKKVWLNIFSEALGSDSLVYLLLLFFVTSILLIKRNYEQ